MPSWNILDLGDDQSSLLKTNFSSPWILLQALEDAGANATTTTTVRHAMILAEHDGLAGAILDHGLE